MSLEPQKDYLDDITDLPNFGYTLAPPLNRLGAAIVQGVIIYLPLSLIWGYSTAFFTNDSYDFEALGIQLLISAIIGAVTYSLWSGNLGHKLFGMKVISAKDGMDQKKATTGALREVLKDVLGNFILPSIWLLWDKKNQNLYDKITNTLVVYENKK